MTLFVVFFLIVGASACLCLSFDKHYKKLMGKSLKSPIKAKLRVGGYTVLLASLVTGTVENGWLGLVYWFGLFSLATAPLPFIVAYLDQRFRLSERAD